MALMIEKPTSICNCGGQFVRKACPHGGYWECVKCGAQDTEIDTELEDLSDVEIANILVALRYMDDAMVTDCAENNTLNYRLIMEHYAEILDGMYLLDTDKIQTLIEKINVT